MPIITDQSEVMASRSRGEDIRDAAFQVSEETDGYAVRYVEEARNTWLRWQVGLLLDHRLNYRGQGMREPIQQTVKLFHLLGFANNREDALAMATRKNRKVVRL